MREDPHLPESTFTRSVVAANRLDGKGFVQWVFHPAMLFGAPDRWWGNGGARPGPHEGIDLCLFRDRSGRVRALPASTRIPAPLAGEVVKLEADFLGLSVFLRHEIRDARGRHLHSFYGHTRPLPGLGPHQRLSAGQPFATLAPTKAGNGKPRPHLHISLAWVEERVPVSGLTWTTLRDREGITLIDPLAVLSGPYAVVRAESVSRQGEDPDVD